MLSRIEFEIFEGRRQSFDREAEALRVLVKRLGQRQRISEAAGAIDLKDQQQGSRFKGHIPLNHFSNCEMESFGHVLKLAFSNVGMRPENHSQQDTLAPGVEHLLDIFRAMSLLRKEGLESRRDGEMKSCEVAEVNNRNALHSVRTVLADGVVPTSDLELVIQPVLIVVAFRCVEYPLTKAFSNGSEIVAEGLSRLSVAEVLHELRGGANEAVPDVENIVNLVGKNVTGHLESLDVLFAEEHRALNELELFEGDVATDMPRGLRGDPVRDRCRDGICWFV